MLQLNEHTIVSIGDEIYRCIWCGACYRIRIHPVTLALDGFDCVPEVLPKCIEIPKVSEKGTE